MGMKQAVIDVETKMRQEQNMLNKFTSRGYACSMRPEAEILFKYKEDLNKTLDELGFTRVKDIAFHKEGYTLIIGSGKAGLQYDPEMAPSKMAAEIEKLRKEVDRISVNEKRLIDMIGKATGIQGVDEAYGKAKDEINGLMNRLEDLESKTNDKEMLKLIKLRGKELSEAQAKLQKPYESKSAIAKKEASEAEKKMKLKEAAAKEAKEKAEKEALDKQKEQERIAKEAEQKKKDEAKAFEVEKKRYQELKEKSDKAKAKEDEKIKKEAEKKIEAEKEAAEKKVKMEEKAKKEAEKAEAEKIKAAEKKLKIIEFEAAQKEAERVGLEEKAKARVEDAEEEKKFDMEEAQKDKEWNEIVQKGKEEKAKKLEEKTAAAAEKNKLREMISKVEPIEAPKPGAPALKAAAKPVSEAVKVLQNAKLGYEASMINEALSTKEEVLSEPGSKSEVSKTFESIKKAFGAEGNVIESDKIRILLEKWDEEGKQYAIKFVPKVTMK